MKMPYLLVFFMCFACISAPKIDVPSLSYEELKPMLFQEGNKTYVVNFWATWCAPCIKELPYFETLNEKPNIEVLLVSLDFPQHKETRLLSFIKKHQLQSKVVHLDDVNENTWINAIDSTWSGALPATIVYNNQKRSFYERSFTQNELETLVKSFNP